MSGIAEVLAEHPDWGHSSRMVFCIGCDWDAAPVGIESAADVFRNHQTAALSAAGFGDVREQQARLDKVEAVAADLAERGDSIEEKYERNGNGSVYSLRSAGRGIGYREAARNIRAALTATEAAS